MGEDLYPMDIYTEMRALRRTNEDLRKYDVFLSAFGNVPKTATKNTERYVRENAGTRIVPYNASHNLRVVGTIITDDSQEGIDCFDRSSLDPGVEVDIDYQPPQVEIITVNISGGSGITDQDKIDIANGVWNHSDARRVLGLLKENLFIDQPVYDLDGNLASARIRLYSDAASVGSDSNVIASYSIAAPASAPGRFTSWSQVKS
jgi:hypothetical protein